MNASVTQNKGLARESDVYQHVIDDVKASYSVLSSTVLYVYMSLSHLTDGRYRNQRKQDTRRVQAARDSMH